MYNVVKLRLMETGYYWLYRVLTMSVSGDLVGGLIMGIKFEIEFIQTW